MRCLKDAATDYRPAIRDDSQNSQTMIDVIEMLSQ